MVNYLMVWNGKMVCIGLLSRLANQELDDIHWYGCINLHILKITKYTIYPLNLLIQKGNYFNVIGSPAKSYINGNVFGDDPESAQYREY